MAEEITWTPWRDFQPQVPQAVIYLKEDSVVFSIEGEIILSISKTGLTTKGLAPISCGQELHDLMLEFFQKAGKKR